MKITVHFGADNMIEAESENSAELARMVNETTKKFFPDTSWLSHDVVYSQS